MPCCGTCPNGCGRNAWQAVFHFAKRGLLVLTTQLIGWTLFSYVEEGLIITDCFIRPVSVAKEDAEMRRYTSFMRNLETKINKTLTINEKQGTYILFRNYFNVQLTPMPIHGTTSWANSKCMKWYRFSVMTMTTIGFGTISPQTDLGKMLLIPYALITIPLMLSFLAIAGSHVSGFANCIMMFIHKTFRGNKPLNCQALIRTFCLLLLVLFYTNIPISRLTALDMSYLDKFYFFFVTYSTVGFGDIVSPAETETFYLIDLAFGLAAISGFVDSVVQLVTNVKFGCTGNHLLCCQFVEEDNSQEENGMTDDLQLNGGENNDGGSNNSGLDEDEIEVAK